MNLLARVFLLSILSGIAYGQTFNMSMDQNFPAWNPCILPGCDPGGLGIPTSYSITETGNLRPENSLEFSVTGPAWSNFLAWDKVGATTATYFNSDFWELVPDSSKAHTQALEYDIFEFLTPYEFMFGSECVIGAQWQIWDHLHGQWISTTRDCTMTFGAWHHIQWWTHRIDGDTSCDGYPCMYYDMLGVDGVYTQFETTEPAGPIPAGWSNNSGLNFQLDINGASTKDITMVEFIKDVNFSELGD
jgi:hypothetical protein